MLDKQWTLCTLQVTQCGHCNVHKRLGHFLSLNTLVQNLCLKILIYKGRKVLKIRVVIILGGCLSFL